MVDEKEKQNPKLFISYSWTDHTHEQWVISLASELRQSGVDVIFDKWDLKEGHDTINFMERMVKDPQIKKVVIIADKLYAEKADDRSGGVGTETQIISKEIYDEQEQEKFVAVVTQKSEKGKPYLPTYYKSRKYIDLSEPDTYGDNFDRLLRWIFDKPFHKKPEIGKMPVYLEEKNVISLGTTTSFKRAIDAIKNDKSYSSGAIDEYFDIFLQNFKKFEVEISEEEIDDTVIENINKFIPYRNELIKLVITINQYSPSEINTQKIHRFFETIIPYMNNFEHSGNHNEWKTDNFKFIVHELFLYVIAIFIKYENFQHANYFLEQKYYIPENAKYEIETMQDFSEFRQYMESLKNRNIRLELRRLSLRADLLKDRCSGIGIKFQHLMQADFVVFIRNQLETEEIYLQWWPETLVWLPEDYHNSFEIFARSISKRYFERVKVLLAIDKPSDLHELLQSFRTNKRSLPKWEYRSFNPVELIGYEKLATLP